MNIKKYKPRPDAIKKLDRAMEHIKSVPYGVSLRWVFYRLWDEGYFPQIVEPARDGRERSAKIVGYKRFVNLARRARHGFYGEWRPDTIVDDTREIEIYGHGYRDVQTARENYLLDTVTGYPCMVNHYYGQQYYVLIGFEARAMAAQFRQYTYGLDLVPMGGDPSIPLKWDIAKLIERRASAYNLPVIFLYFGDSDKKGKQIFNTTIQHLKEWSGISFEYKWCGLTDEHVAQYNLEAAIDKPGYQWESLNDPQAREIIENSLIGYFDIEARNAAMAESEMLQKEFMDTIANLGSLYRE